MNGNDVATIAVVPVDDPTGFNPKRALSVGSSRMGSPATAGLEFSSRPVETHNRILQKMGRLTFAPMLKRFYSDDDTVIERQRKAVLIPIFIIVGVFLFVYGAKHFIDGYLLKGVVWTVGLALCVLPVGYCMAHRRLPQIMGEACFIIVAFLVSILSDLLAFGMFESWMYLILLDLALVVAHAYELSLFISFFLSITYVCVRTVEDSQRMGLYDILPNYNSYDPPEPIGWGRGSNVIISRILVLVITFLLSCWFYLSMTNEQSRFEVTVKLAEDVSAALCRFDLRTAEQVLSQRTEQSEALHSSLWSLLVNLKLYRPYLPDAFFDENGRAVGGIIEAEEVDICILPGSPSRVSQLMELPDSVSKHRPSSASLHPNSLVIPMSESRGNIASSSSNLHILPPSSSNPLFHPPPGSPLVPARSEGDWAVPPLDPPSSRAVAQITQLDAPFVQDRKGTLLVFNMDLGRPGTRDVHTTFDLCTSFTGLAIDAIRQEKGVVLELLADTIVGSWNTHRTCTRHSLQACRAALSAGRQLRRYRSAFKRKISKPGFVHPVRWWGITLASGRMCCGHIGDDRLKAPFVLGSPSIQARLLLSLGRRVRIRLLATEAVQEAVQDVFDMRPVDIIPVDPLADLSMGPELQNIVIYSLRDELPTDGVPNNVNQVRTAYDQAFFAMRKGSYSAAVSAFNDLLAGGDLDGLETQVFRLRAIAQLLAETNEPFCRTLVGWQEIVEGNPLRSEDMPQILTDGEVYDTPGSADRKRLARTFSSYSDSSTESNLRREIDQARKRYIGSNSSASLQANTPNTDGEVVNTDEPPREFTDHQGSKWYRTKRLLGEGGRGEVWLGINTCGALIALKTIQLRRFRRGADVVDDILREVGLLRSLQHENVVEYMSSGVGGEHVVLVMEYMPGGSLQSLFDIYGPLPLPGVKRYTKDILRGLAYLHSKKIAHRDMKPANILLAIDGQCKLADFGAAAELSANTVQERDGKQAFVGSPPYIAPEACKGEACRASDIWSLGVILSLLISGQMVYNMEGMNMFRFIHRLACDDTFLPQVPERLDPTAADLIKKCLQRRPQDRPLANDLLLHPFVTQCTASSRNETQRLCSIAASANNSPYKKDTAEEF